MSFHTSTRAVYNQEIEDEYWEFLLLGQIVLLFPLLHSPS